MDTDWKEWDVTGTVEGLHVPHFLTGDWETVEEYNQQTSDLVAEHWNQFRAMLADEDNASHEGLSEVKGGGYTALCRLRERLDSRHEKIQESVENWEFKANLQKLIIAGFEQKVKELANERVTDSEDTEPSEEEFKDAWEQVLDRPMGQAWLADNSDSPSLLQTNASAGWQVNPVYTRWASEESEGEIVEPDGPQLSDLTIRYLPEDNRLEWEDIDADSVSRRDVRSFDGDTTWNDALEKLKRPFKAYRKQREQYARTLRVIEFRRRILKNVLHQFEAYGSVEEMTQERAGEIAQKERRGRSKRMMDWEINAAQLFAYVQEHGQPSSKEELENQTKVSTRQVWEKLQDQDYGMGRGVKGLVSALREWAPEFEKEHDIEKVRRAASPFTWPVQHEE